MYCIIANAYNDWINHVLFQQVTAVFNLFQFIGVFIYLCLWQLLKFWFLVWITYQTEQSTERKCTTKERANQGIKWYSFTHLTRDKNISLKSSYKKNRFSKLVLFAILCDRATQKNSEWFLWVLKQFWVYSTSDSESDTFPVIRKKK